jgi:hypothetical protein
MPTSSFETLARAAVARSNRDPIDQRLYRMAEHLSGMIHAGEFENCPSYVVAELEQLPIAILDAADDAVTLITERPRVPRRIVYALAASAAASIFSGMLAMGFGAFRLGLTEIIFAGCLMVWASLVRG